MKGGREVLFIVSLFCFRVVVNSSPVRACTCMCVFNIPPWGNVFFSVESLLHRCRKFVMCYTDCELEASVFVLSDTVKYLVEYQELYPYVYLNIPPRFP